MQYGEMVVDNVPLEEWKVARNTLKEFDDRTHDLRKFGFSFLTALLTAESILIPGPLAESLGKVALPGAVRLCILLVTLLFILAISLIERNYQLFIKAIVQRALVLEPTLNIELSEIITNRYREGRAQHWRDGLYALFVFVVLVLGYAILMPDLPLFLVLVFFSSFVIVAIFWMMKRLDLQYSHGQIDWSLDRNQCQEGDSVAITITNLSPKIVQGFGVGRLFEVRSLDGANAYPHVLEYPIVIEPEDNYTCIWDTKSRSPPVTPGMYQVFPDGWGRALRRKITVIERPKTKEADGKK
jgi:hypothetical protein